MKKIVIAIIALSLPIAGFSMQNGNGNNMNKPKMSKEDKIKKHEQMKDIHDKAINCLKSDKDPMECRKEFKSNMKDIRGNRKVPQQQNGFDQQIPKQADGYNLGDTNEI